MRQSDKKLHVSRAYPLLEIAAATHAELTNKIRDLARASAASGAGRLRSGALGLAARSGDPELLRMVAESDWGNHPAEDSEGFESWYGSLALLKAAQAGLIEESTALLDRISPRLYGCAAVMLGDPAVQEIARRIDALIRRATGLPDALIAPDIELEAEHGACEEPTRFSVSERERPSANSHDFFKQLSESDEDFRNRQNRNHDTFTVFREELKAEEAEIVLDQFTREEFSAVVAAAPKIADRWHDLFMEINDSRLPAVHNLMLLLAGAISDRFPEKSAALLERTTHSRPLVHFRFGRSGVDLGSISAWTGGGAPALKALRRKRLDHAATDYAISVEVFSALRCSQQQFLESYVDEKVARAEPAEIARGIMVAGFCDRSSRNDQILERYRDTEGLPGKAYAAAIAAYRCNNWARHWFKTICETDDAVTFWQAGVLFTQCVDDRFSVWRDEFKQTGGPIGAFSTSLKNPLKRRQEKSTKEREKTLFGQDAPAPIFVQAIYEE